MKNQEIEDGINPAVKKDDKIIVIKSHNNSVPEGEVLTVITARNKATKSNFTVKNESGMQFSVYYTAPADEFILADRENLIKYHREKITLLEKEIISHKLELEFLTKYESEEEFVAAKLNDLFDAHAKGGTKSTKVKTMTAILKELKQSNII